MTNKKFFCGREFPCSNSFPTRIVNYLPKSNLNSYNRNLNLLFICDLGLNRSKTAALLFSKNYNTDYLGLYNPFISYLHIENKLRWANLIFVMEQKHLETIREKFPKIYQEQKEKMFNLDVPDVYIRNQQKLKNILKEKIDLVLTNLFSPSNYEIMKNNSLYYNNAYKSLVTEKEIELMTKKTRYNPSTKSFNYLRPVVFIDLQELRQPFLAQGMEPNYSMLLKEIKQTEDQEVDFRIYASKFGDLSITQKNFFRQLEDLGFKVITRDCRISLENENLMVGKSIVIEKGTDVSLAIDMISLAYRDIFKSCYIITEDYEGKYQGVIDLVRKELDKNVIPLYSSEFLTSGINRDILTNTKRLFGQLLTEWPDLYNFQEKALNDLKYYAYSFSNSVSNQIKHRVYLDYRNVEKSLLDYNRENKLNLTVFESLNLVKEYIWSEINENQEELNTEIELCAFLGTYPPYAENSRLLEQNNLIGNLDVEGKLKMKIITKTGTIDETNTLREIGVDILMAGNIIYDAYRKIKGTSKPLFKSLYVLSNDADFLPVYEKLIDLNSNFKVLMFQKNSPENVVDIIQPHLKWIEDILSENLPEHLKHFKDYKRSQRNKKN